jgi:predicted AlkP superfamily phosphohydrolase/phosphomutase
MAKADKNTYIALSSDHGAVPLDSWVHLNNLFAQNGWLKFTIDPQTGEPVIDWANSQVIYLKMSHVYINPSGLDGDYKRATGPEYEALRDQVRQVLMDLTDTNGIKPVVEVVNWEDAQQFLKLDPERVGDLVIANKPGYGWNEEMSSSLEIFTKPLKTGYKQAIMAEEVSGMWTPFIISGPNIKANNYLGDEPIDHIDQYPTIMTALSKVIPDVVQGKTLDIFK